MLVPRRVPLSSGGFPPAILASGGTRSPCSMTKSATLAKAASKTTGIVAFCTWGWQLARQKCQIQSKPTSLVSLRHGKTRIMVARPNSPHSGSIMAAWSQFGEDDAGSSLSCTSGTLDSTRSLMAVALSLLIWPHSVVVESTHQRLKRLQKWLAIQFDHHVCVTHVMCQGWASAGDLAWCV